MVVDPINPGSANAVRVVAARNDVSYFIAGLMGIPTTDVKREAIAMVNVPCFGIWGKNSVDVPGNVRVDSYDSTVGAYAPGAYNENGDVCSNGDSTVGGSIEIYGDVMPGLGSLLTISGSKLIITVATCPHTATT